MISWRDGGGALHRGSLFDVFAALSRGEAWSFPALRPHQREPWHAFLCQVAAQALIRGETDAMPETEDEWRALLLALTPDQPGGEAWSLVVDDWSKPALLQPPLVTAANRADYKNRLATPDALDMLVTAKNHDVKQERIADASEEDWLFALVTLQTTEGFLGAGNYGISRMNGGFASRMTMGVRPTGGAADAFRRDVRRLVEHARGRAGRRQGLGLLWLEPWDGTQSLEYEPLDELYVEICRRVRLQRGPQGTEALAAGSKCARVAAAQLKGKTGDPWAPVKADESSSHTPSGLGFGYRQIAQLLDKERITPPLLARLHKEDDPQGLSIVVAALVRGQGKTEGLHRRTIPISRLEELWAMGPVDALDKMSQAAIDRANDAYEAGRRLRRALILLMQGGPDQARLDDDSAGRKADPWVRRFDQDVDRRFFDEDFWAEATGKEGSHRRIWRGQLHGEARQVMAQAAEAAPRTEMRRIRAVARSRTMLDAQMHKWIKEVPDGE